MKALNFTVIKLALCLIAGILIGHYTSFAHTFPLTVGFFFLLFIVYLISGKHLKKTIFGLIAYLTTLFLGMLTVEFHDEKLRKNHYTHVVKDTEQTLLLKVRERMKPTRYSNRYVVQVLEIDPVKTTGRTVLSLPIDSLKKPFKVDDLLMTKAQLRPIYPPLNPGQFDYKTYMQRQYVYHQIYAERSYIIPLHSGQRTLYGIADQIRNHIEQKLEAFPFKQDELAVIKALLLGQRQDIDPDLYEQYTRAGAVHILAVSGLHIGIILLLLNGFFSPLERFKHGKTIKIMLIVSILWEFAIISGLSPSVTRAVTMFSIVAIGMNLKRPTNIYNTLAISVFVLLLCKPMFLFQAGFQLSYLAVLGIVSVQPLLYHTISKPKNYILNKLWEVITVTIAAQVGILPLGLYYFHQFPGLFLITNLVIIPVLGFILGFGIVVILLASIGLLPEIIAVIFGKTISVLNTFIEWVGTQDEFLFENISFGSAKLITFYLLIITVVLWLKIRRKTYRKLVAVMVSVILVQGVFLYEKFQKKNNNLIVFHKSRYTVLGQRQGHLLTVNHDLDSLLRKTDNTISNYVVAHHFSEVKEDSVPEIVLKNDIKLLIVDSLGVYKTKTFKPDYVLLRQSPKINLNRLLDSLQTKTIIADGSNYKSYVARWKATCKKRKHPFHHTGETGAFIIK